MARKFTDSGVDLSESRIALILSVEGIAIILAFTAVILRVISRHMRGMRLWLDDYFIIFALANITGNYIIHIYGSFHHYGQHFQLEVAKYPTYEDAAYVILLPTFFTEVLYTNVALGVKLSMLSFYYRIFGQARKMRLAIWGIAGCACGWAIGRYIGDFIHCRPYNGFWDLHIKSKCSETTGVFWFLGALSHCCVDFAILLLPVPYVWSLDVTRKQKLGLTALFGCGFIACLFAILTMVVIKHTDFDGADLTWNLWPLGTVAACELYVAIICACLPSLRPIFSLLRRKAPSLRRKSYMGTDSKLPTWPTLRSLASRPGENRNSKNYTGLVETLPLEERAPKNLLPIHVPPPSA